jgi:hypothetical protein
MLLFLIPADVRRTRMFLPSVVLRRISGVSREFLSKLANRGVRDSRYREGGPAPWVFVAARVTYIDR